MANDFIQRVAAAALADFDGAVSFLGLSGGKNSGREYLPINPTRNDTKPGSLSINRDSGAWSDFATDDKGGDLVALAAYVLGCRQIEAAERLADYLGIAKPDCQNQRQMNERAAGDRTAPSPAKKPQEATPADGAVCLMPVPADVPPPPVAHSRHGKPAGRWAYRDAAGEVCFYHDRYEPKGERKQFAPLTLWRFQDGRLQWQFKAPSGPRPLLGLPELAAADPARPAVLVEGEKARDAALLLFPENPVLTWQGGAQAVSKADWSPLASRECWIWPDNDPAGSKAARDVAAALFAVNAEKVAVFNLATFARRAIEADGTAALADGDPLAEGDDAADVLARGWTAAHAALVLLEPDTLRPVERAGGKAEAGNASEPAKAGRFQLDGKGVWLIETDRAPRWVCSPVEPVAMVRDPRNYAWGLLVEFFDPDRALHRVIVPMALFRGDGAEVAGLLLDQGLRIAPRGKPALVEYLQTASPKARARVTNRTGWHDAGPDGAVFVLPGDAIGPNAGAWIYESEGGPVHTFAMRDKLSYWRSEVANLCSGNSRLLFAVSVCFASPLLYLIGAESGGFHFRSNSSDGKTTALRVAASVCGGADFMQRWRATSNGLEALASAHCDAPLLLDELAQMDPREAGETCYMLANGSGKSRAGRTGGARDRASWRLLFLSCGEIGLSEHLGEIGKTPRAGQELRLAEIPADAGAGLGVFENLHDYADGSQFAKALDRAARRYYGTAFHAFVAKLATNQEAVPDLVREAQRKFEAHCLNNAAHGQARRVAGRFALVGAAGELATKWGITEWEPGEAMQAARTCFDAWLSRRGGQGNQEEKAMLRQVREFIRRKGESAFTDWDRPANDTDKHAPGKPDRAGYRRGCHDAEGNDAQEYFLFNEAWRGVVCKGYDAAAVGRLLVAKGYCRKGSETDRPWLVRENLPTEGRARVVHILPALFDSDDD